MKFTPNKINIYLLFKLPSAFFTGVRVKDISTSKVVVAVKHRWINQNPFRSLYYGVQAMAAELSTGVLVMRGIHDSNRNISMLVTKQSAEFTKKGRGMILFTCNQGDIIKAAIDETIRTGMGQTIILESQAVNEKGEQVSFFSFEWSLILK